MTRDCGWFEQVASDDLDGELHADERRLLAAHFAQCQDCADRDGQLRMLRDLLKASSTVDPPYRQSTEIFARIEADENSLIGRLWRLLPGFNPQLLPTTGVAATAITLLAILLLASPEPPRPEPPPTLTSETRSETVLTVWESSADRIVASSTHLSLPELDQIGGPFTPILAPSREVRIFLYERIVVRG